LLAVVVMLAVALLLAATAWRSWHRRPADRAQTVLGGAILLILAFHSLVDYPLRSMALACLAGVGAGLLSRPSSQDAAALRAAVTEIRGVELAV
jgi:hypothetical protein